MSAEELFKSGQLQAAQSAQTEAVKSRPTDLSARTFLFELLCFNGEFDRASKQLDTIEKLDDTALQAVQVYRNTVFAESLRARTLNGQSMPEFFLDPPAWVEDQFKAVAAFAKGDAQAAKQHLDSVEQARAIVNGGSAEDEPQELRDADDLVGPVLEFMIVRDYLWVPFEQITELEVSAPERPRDLIWAPTRLTLCDGSQRSGYVPVRYFQSETNESEAIRLGRATEWLEESSSAIVCGRGQRIMMLGEEGADILGLGNIFIKSNSA